MRVGDFVRYTPESMFRRDGLAEVHADYRSGDLYGKDTFDQNDTRLTEGELATATVLFNLDEFEERPHLFVTDYAAADVFVLHTRKGMVERNFLRRGAPILDEKALIARRQAQQYADNLRARAEMLSPLADQSYAATPLPTLTIAETSELIDTIRWVQRASRDFEQQLHHLIGIQSGRDGNLHIQAVLADEDHYELVRARRALDKKVVELRAK